MLKNIQKAGPGMHLLAVFTLYIALLVFHPFLHSHQVDGQEHPDCSACMWNLELGKALITCAVIFSAALVFAGFYSKAFGVFNVPLVVFDHPARSPPPA